MSEPCGWDELPLSFDALLDLAEMGFAHDEDLGPSWRYLAEAQARLLGLDPE